MPLRDNQLTIDKALLMDTLTNGDLTNGASEHHHIDNNKVLIIGAGMGYLLRLEFLAKVG